MNYNELIKSRRSIRKFKDKEVSMEMIEELIQESTCAPSAGNGQPWNFFVINNREVMNQISTECKESLLKKIENNPEAYVAKYSGILEKKDYNIFYNAPALVFIHGDSSLKNVRVDCTLAASYFMFAATSRGLGTCWINFGLPFGTIPLAKECGFPVKNEIVAPLILGYPAVMADMPKRNKPEILYGT